MRFSGSTAVVIGFLTLVFGVSALSFILFENNRFEAEIVALESETESIVRSDERARSAREQLKLFQTERAVMRAYVVPAQGVVDFLVEIETAGDRAGATVRINSVSEEGTTSEGNPFETLVIAIIATGSWDALYTFADALSVMPFALQVKRMTLEYTEEGWRASYTVHVLKEK